ncbi:MAG TPA: aldo/keto reductase [Micromonosporaceae bacterium]|jgi:diketogulonate reductase-like aldo/keto reductase|nr:aldo/keto reductase [Micromonosporaceae bacterium]
MTHPMPRVPLTADLSLPMVGFGTWQLNATEAYDATRVALDTGYRHIDTATLYGNEVDVGRAIRDSGVPRDELFVTTKLPPDRVNRVRSTLEQSLRLLGLDHVDLWLIHWPPSGTAAVDTWREFIEQRDAGLTTTIGVSNYDLGFIDELAAATGEAPAVNQISWSPTRFDPVLVEGHRERGVVLEGYSPLKKTNLRDATLVEIAAEHGVTPAQVVLRWHIEHEIPVIPRSSKAERVASNFDLFGFSLSGDEVKRIDAMGG